MKIINNIAQLKAEIIKLKELGHTIGFVPTMGYLHKGHISLVSECIKNGDKAIMSIFVNPTQFAPNEDFSSYPRDLERDRLLAESAGVSLLFVPEISEMYPANSSTFVSVGNELTKKYEGVTRPTHFDGVTTIVNKLFNIVMPDRAYFGQKDAQQAMIINKMVKDLFMPVEIVVCPIIRENDGLAMSSRNVYLSAEERNSALVLNRSIREAVEQIDAGNRIVFSIIDEMKSKIEATEHVALDYVEIVNPSTFERLSEIEDDYLILVAAFVGKTRLIDNHLGKRLEQ